MFHPEGPSVLELTNQWLSSTQLGYDLLAPKFDYTPFRTPDSVLSIVRERIRPLAPMSPEWGIIKTLDHGYPVDPDRQCGAKVKGTHHRCKRPTVVDRHFCAYHSGLGGPRFDPFRDIGEEEDFLEYQPVHPDSVA